MLDHELEVVVELVVEGKVALAKLGNVSMSQERTTVDDVHAIESRELEGIPGRESASNRQTVGAGDFKGRVHRTMIELGVVNRRYLRAFGGTKDGEQTFRI